MTPIKIKKLNEKAQLPKQATDGSAGYDLVACTEEKVKLLKDVPYIKYGTGLAIQIPKGYVGLLFPRSSISTTKTLALGNSVGVLDSDYTGEVSFVFKDLGRGSGIKYTVGDRIGQLVVVPLLQVSFEEVESLEETKRGDGGWGSTGK